MFLNTFIPLKVECLLDNRNIRLSQRLDATINELEELGFIAKVENNWDEPLQ